MPTKTVIHVVPHTHWDREWYEPFESYRFRLVGMVDQLLEVLETDQAFAHFNFDGQIAAIEDYLEIRPGAEADIARQVQAGRLGVGPWRILMDEFLCSPETIVRNLQQGTSRAASLGRSQQLGYIPDSFGHIAQMPQILRLCGFTEATVWRGVPRAVDRTQFNWEAPDGSRVRAAYLVTSYGNAAALPEGVEDLLVRTRRIVKDLAPYDPGDLVLAMNGSDHQPPATYISELFAKANAIQDEFEFRIGSMEQYLSETAGLGDLPTWRGEMRSSARANLLMGVLSARMPLKQAEFAASASLERYAEPLSALARQDTGRLLERAWRWMVENSAHDSVCGCGIDAVADQVLARYRQAAHIADLVAADSLEALAGKMDTSALTDETVVAWNPSPRARAGVLEVTLTPPGGPKRLAFRGQDGALALAQVLSTEEQRVIDMTLRGDQLASIVPNINSRKIGELYINALSIEGGRTKTIRLAMGPVLDGEIDIEQSKVDVERTIERNPKAKFHVIADGPPLCRVLIAAPDVAGLGWATLTPGVADAPDAGAARADGHMLDNGLVRAEVQADGRITLITRDGSRHDGLFGIEDGADAGDEYNYSPPDKDLIVTEPAAPAIVDVVRAGPVEATLRVTRRYRIPASLDANERGRARRTTWMPVVTDLTLRAGEPFLRASMEITNDAKDHRVRATFPLGFDAAYSHADGAFYVNDRELDAEGDAHEVGLPTFPARRWVDASDGARGLAVFHRGTPEYELVEGRALAITLLRNVGWLSRQGMRYRAGPAGPMLATPGAQLPGTHRFELAVYPHTGDWRAGGVHDIAESFAYPLRATVTRRHPGVLPATAGALTIEPRSVQLSAFVRTGDAIVCRVFNASEEAVDARITLGDAVTGADARLVGLLGDEGERVAADGRVLSLPLRAWEIASIRIG
ncbi:MAG: alpha-mannosidase [Actinomycetota bacterium]